MKKEQEYIEDLSQIRSMMERSTKFLSLTGVSGILAGIYALAGSYITYLLFYRNTGEVIFNSLDKQQTYDNLGELVLLAAVILILAVGTAVFLSYRKAAKNNEVLWNPVARRLFINMSIPLITGGILILVLISKGIFGLIAPLTLIFYGLSLINASKFTFDDLRYLGIIQIILGLISSYFIEYVLIFWALGFGVMHIVYGIFMHLKYEK